MPRPHPNLPPRRFGMTLVELCVGLVITTLVLGALSAMWFAVAHTWAKSSGTQHVNLTAGQAAARLENAFRTAKYICQFSAGSVSGGAANPGAVLYWKGDNWMSTTDGAVQIGELALIEHDPADKKLYQYQAMPYASMSASQRVRAGGVATWADLSLASTRATFKSYDFVQRSVISEAVTGALFNVPAATGNGSSRQVVEFTLSVTRDGGSALTYSTAAVRGPTSRPL